MGSAVGPAHQDLSMFDAQPQVMVCLADLSECFLVHFDDHSIGSVSNGVCVDLETLCYPLLDEVG